MVYYTSDVFEDVELIGECDAVAGCDGEDFMLAVAVEGCPLDRRVIGGITAEIEESLNALYERREGYRPYVGLAGRQLGIRIA